MTHSIRLGLTLLAIFWGVAAASDPAPTIVDYVVEADEQVDGRPLHIYANEWWKWAYSMPDDRSPVIDTHGALCHVNQTGPVWFLAGGYGSSKIHRTCTIPAEQHIFFPVINVVYYTPPGVQQTCETAKRNAARNNHGFVFIRVSLNGERLENAERFRLASAECFDIFARIPEEYNAPSAAPSATDGFWIMLKPLPSGTHRLEFRAFYTEQGSSIDNMVQNISYDLTILPE